jgi:phytanoyl-CoA hydroxylase
MDQPDGVDLAAWYVRDGYVIVESLFAEARVAELERELERYLREIAPGVPAGDIVYETDGQAVRNLWRLEEHDPYFAALERDPVILGLARQLLPAAAVPMAVETFNKPARVGSAVPYHQDNAYFNYEPADVLTIWIALDESTPENGCMIVAEGSHRWGLLPHRPSGVAGNSQGAFDLPEETARVERHVQLRRGDASVHHCLTLHRSEPNRSDRPRRGLLLVYRSADAVLDRERFSRYMAEYQAFLEKQERAAEGS